MTPKGSQNETKSHPNGCSLTPRNMWFLLYRSHIGPLWLSSGSTFFLRCFPDPVVFSFCPTFWDFGVQKGPQMADFFLRKLLQIRPRRPKAPKVLQSAPKWSPRVPKWSQSGPRGCQNDAKVTPRGCQNRAQGPRNSDFKPAPPFRYKPLACRL